MIDPPNAKEPFPSRLHKMLNDIEVLSSTSQDTSAKKLKDYVSWLDHGLGFKIYDKRKFEQEVMPTWFNRLKCNSFLRQLSLYGFVRKHHLAAEKGGRSGCGSTPIVCAIP